MTGFCVSVGLIVVALLIVAAVALWRKGREVA